MTAADRINTFLRAASARFSTHDSEIARQLSEALLHTHSEASKRRAVTVPASVTLPDLLAGNTDELMRTLSECASDLYWRQAGFGRLPEKISQSVSVVEILGPGGMFHRTDLRFGLLNQCAGLQYPKHWHAAEELYLVLNGTAVWTVGANVPTQREPGAFVHHQSLQSHAMMTRSEPLLALWGWTGDIEASTYST